MGFECGFSLIRKKPNCSFQEYQIAKIKIDYESNSWAKENYKTFEDYWKNYYLDEKELVHVSEDIIDFYKNNKEIDLFSWYSNGRYFDDDIIEFLTKVDSYNYLVLKENFNELFNYTEERLNSIDFVPVQVTHSIMDKDNGLFLQSINGIQVEDFDNNIYQIFNDSDYNNIFILKDFIDEDEVYSIKNLMETLLQIKYINFDDYFVIYWRSF